MANGFGSFFVGSSGLMSAQNALNVTANNLANVDTKGYVRQQVVFSDKHYNAFRSEAIGVNVQQAGLGVSIGDVVHARDIFLDKAYRQENGRQSFYETCYTTVSQIEDLFQELNGEEFKQSVSDLNTAFQELAKAPGDPVNQNLVIQKSELFVARTISLYSDLQSYQANMNEQINESIERINEIGKRVYQLNLDIQKIEGAGVETAMTLRDERDSLIDELSEYGTVSFKEDATGFLWLDFQDVEFITEYGPNRIEMKADNGTGFFTPYWTHLSDVPRGQYYKVYNLDSEINSELNTDIGSIKALLHMRGSEYGRYTDMLTVDSYSRIEGSAMMETEAQLDLMFHSVITSINDMLCPNIELTDNMYDSAGRLVAAQGSKILDTDNCDVGVDGKLPPNELFSRIGMERYKEVKYIDDNGREKSVYIYNEEDARNSSTMYQIGNIQVNDALLQEESLLPVMKQSGAVDYGLAQQMVAVWEHKGLTITPKDNSECNFEDFYDKLIGNLGTAGNVYDNESQTLTTTVTSLDNKRLQVTGVSSDEELTHMIKYQAAYNAASRYISVISEMTDLIVSGLV